MNPNLSTPNSHTDARIDHVLNALRSTEAPAGLEDRVAQRVAARLSQATESHQKTAAPLRLFTTKALTPSRLHLAANRASLRSFFTVILSEASRGFMRGAQSKDPCISLVPARLYTLAALILLPILATIAIYSHRTPHTTAQSNTIPTKPYTTETAASLQAPIPANPTRLSNLPNPHLHQSLSPALHQSLSPASHSSTTNPQVPQGFSLGSHNPTQRAGVLTPASDPETIALAETLAPSHPAPPLPLTQQELLLLTATRQGAPIEVAELTLANEPAFRAAAEARRDAKIRRFAQSLFAPIAIAASLESTTQDAEPSSPTPVLTSSN